MAALGAEVMVSGHGLPVFGAGRIAEALTDTADLLDAIESQTLALMNTGATLDQVLREVEVPAGLRGKPYLRPVYDHPQFLVRNVWRRYGGGTTGSRTTCSRRRVRSKPAPGSTSRGVSGRCSPGSRS
jgi:alkyl sulfatase BDS1-like metallo-beta-lactamase superfamily hydrolase